MDSKDLEAIIDNSTLRVFGIRHLHDDETVAVGSEMPESYVWDDGDRTEQPIGGTCAFVIPDPFYDYAIEAAMQRAAKYQGLSGRYALLGGKYVGNSDLIEEPHMVAIRDAVVLAIW